MNTWAKSGVLKNKLSNDLIFENHSTHFLDYLTDEINKGKYSLISDVISTVLLFT